MIFGSDEGQELIKEIKETIIQQKEILIEIKKLHGVKYVEDKEVISMQIRDLTENLKKLKTKVFKILSELSI